MNETTDNSKGALLDAVREICAQYEKMDIAREQVKNIVNALHDSHDVPKPLIRKVSRLYHKRNAAAFEAETSEIKNLYKTITTV